MPDKRAPGEGLPLPHPEKALLIPMHREMLVHMHVVLEALEKGHSRHAAAGIAGIRVGRLYDWLSASARMPDHPLYPWFHQEVCCREATAEKKMADIVIKEATEKMNWKAAMFILQKRYGWSERMREDPIVAREHKIAALKKTKADTVYVQERTKLLGKESNDEMSSRILEALNAIKHGDGSGGEPSIN